MGKDQNTQRPEPGEAPPAWADAVHAAVTRRLAEQDNDQENEQR